MFISWISYERCLIFHFNNFPKGISQFSRANFFFIHFCSNNNNSLTFEGIFHSFPLIRIDIFRFWVNKKRQFEVEQYETSSSLDQSLIQNFFLPFPFSLKAFYNFLSQISGVLLLVWSLRSHVQIFFFLLYHFANLASFTIKQNKYVESKEIECNDTFVQFEESTSEKV